MTTPPTQTNNFCTVTDRYCTYGQYSNCDSPNCPKGYNPRKAKTIPAKKFECPICHENHFTTSHTGRNHYLKACSKGWLEA